MRKKCENYVDRFRSGIAKDGTYAGSVPITVNAEPGSSATPIVGTGGHYSLYLKIDSTAGLLPEAQSTTNTLSYTWNTLLYPPGNLNIKIVAYDNNNNRSELNIPVTVGPRSGTPPTFAPTAYVWGEQWVTAITFGQNLGLYNTEPPRMPPRQALRARDLGFDFDAAITSAQPYSTVLVDIMVLRRSTTTGINVYRSNSESDPQTLVGGATNSVSAHMTTVYEYIDCSADSQPGSTVYYKLAFF